MASQYRHRRTSSPSTPFPGLLEPGEIAVNTANRQLALGDADGATIGTPLPLLTIRYFDARAQYSINDYVMNNGIVYRAKAAVPPGAFNAANWDVIANPGTFVLKAGDTMTGHLSLPTAPAAGNAVRKDYVDAGIAALAALKVDKAGDTLTGFLTLHADPDAPMKAATKQYIDNKAALTVSDTPPGSPQDGSMWWDSDTGTLYVRYNDSVGAPQWVQAVATPAIDTSAFVLKTANSDFAAMSNGRLTVSAAAGALTVALKTFVGANPSPADPVYFYFRNGVGYYSCVAVTAPLSLVLNAGVTLGFNNNSAGRIWITAHNNLGVVVLGAIKCSDTLGVMCPQENLLYATALPGNLTRTFYASAAIPGGASWRFIGFCEWLNIATAGTWTTPDYVSLFGPGTSRPGEVIQTHKIETSTQTTHSGTTWSTTALLLNNIPMTSKANLLELFAVGGMTQGAITYAMTTIFKYATSAPIGTQGTSFGGDITQGPCVGTLTNYAIDFPNAATASYTVAIANNNSAGPVTYPFGVGIFTAKELMG